MIVGRKQGASGEYEWNETGRLRAGAGVARGELKEKGCVRSRGNRSISAAVSTLPLRFVVASATPFAANMGSPVVAVRILAEGAIDKQATSVRFARPIWDGAASAHEAMSRAGAGRRQPLSVC